MLTNLYTLSYVPSFAWMPSATSRNSVVTPTTPVVPQPHAKPLPRFGRDYDYYDKRVESARTFPSRLGYMAERFLATTMPHSSLTQIEDLTPKHLKLLNHEIKGVIFDLDDTLMPILSGQFPEPVIKTLHRLKRAGFKMGIVTNNMQPEYCRKARELLHKEGLDIPFIEDARKPDPSGFLAMRDHLGLKSSQVAVVGDGYLCDIRNANLQGMVSVQACWFSQRIGGATTCYTLDTLAAMLQTVRSYMSAKSEHIILDKHADEAQKAS